MSYILDALKKSEQERGNGRIPDVQTIHSSSLSYRSEKKAYWPYALIAAVMLNLFAISYFIINKDNPVEPRATTKSGTVTEHTATANSLPANEPALPVPASVADDDNEKVDISEPLPETGTPAENSTVAATEPVEKPVVKEVQDKAITDSTQPETSASGETPVIEFHELPDSIKQQLPAIITSAHVYSSNPAQRSMVINNNFMEEGEYVLDGLILQRITPDGAIFSYQGTLFNYAVVSGWQ